MTTDHYEILGLQLSASEQEIKAAYRRLAFRAHPDVGGSAALFRLVEEAHSVLSDPVRRRQYDAMRQQKAGEGRDAAVSPRSGRPPGSRSETDGYPESEVIESEWLTAEAARPSAHKRVRPGWEEHKRQERAEQAAREASAPPFKKRRWWRAP